jgi:hypothetical protein
MLGMSGVEDFIFSHAFGGGNFIKSIQRGRGTMSTSSRTIDLSKAVDITKAIPIITFRPDDIPIGDQTARNNFIRSRLYEPTKVSLIRNDNDYPMYYSYQVIEFYSVKSLQTGIISFTDRSYNHVVNAVNFDKCMLFADWEVEGGYIEDSMVDYSLISSNTLNFEKISDANAIVNYKLAEFY